MNKTVGQTKLDYIGLKFAKHNKLGMSSSRYSIADYNFQDDCSCVKLTNSDNPVASRYFIRIDSPYRHHKFD